MLASCCKTFSNINNLRAALTADKLRGSMFYVGLIANTPTSNISHQQKHKKNSKMGLPLSFACLTVLSVIAAPSAHADSILGIELSPATCKLHPYMTSLRQCIEGNPMTVNFYRVTNQNCSNNRYTMTPLQENIISKVIPDGNIRKNIWQQYGRCSGQNSSTYFRTITSLASQLKLPKELSSGRSYRFTSSGFSRQLLSLNPGMKPNSFNLFCQKNSAGQSVLTYINVCYDNNARFAQCATRSYSCPSQFLIDGNY